LFYQLKVKLLAEQAGISGVSAEGGQIILRYPPLPEGETFRTFPEFNGNIRSGKNSIWIPFSETNGWQEILVEVLQNLIAS
jgi:transcription-repair coupling factor (superfamily II helicase)